MERWHQPMRNRVLPENSDLPGDQERQIGAFVDDYKNQRHHENLGNLTPVEVYHGHGAKILTADTPPFATSKPDRTINHTNEPEPPILKPL